MSARSLPTSANLFHATAFALCVLSIWAAMLPAGSPRRAHAAISGADSDCQEWRILFDFLLFDFDIEIAEEGWVWANGEDTTDKFREASGVVTKSKVAHNDTPANHYSHDWNVDVRVDPGQEGLLSNVNGPNSEDDSTYAELVPATKIEMEWETGVLPGETSGDGASPFLPRWVLPNLGDRVWTEGHWVFDCGHAKNVGTEWTTVEVNGVPVQVLVNPVKHFRTEIHPGRAIATMRSQAQTLPGSGTTPVPVTSTDLHIHGRGAYMVQQLECGIDWILVNIPSTCPVQYSPIDELFTFEVCLPPKPVDWATLQWSIAAGPGDDGFGADPEITKATATGGCVLPPDEYGNDFDDGTMLNVEVDLQGTGISPTDVYARKIVAGWVYPPSTPLPHLGLQLELLDLHADKEFDPFDAEMTFWWMGLDRAPLDEWHRLVNHEIPTFEDVQFPCPNHTNRLNDIDDDDLCGNGELEFSGPLWEFYLRHGQSLSLHTTGFEQDCYDDHFGSGIFSILDYVDCHFANFFLEFTNDWGNNDPLEPMDAYIVPPGGDPLALLGPHNPGVGGQFDFELTLSQVPLADEDDSDLSVSKSCSQDGEVPLAGEPFTCTIVVTNTGPGLPRNVVVTDTLTSSLAAGEYSVGQAMFHVGSETDTFACGAPSATGFSCAIGTVPVGGSVTIEVVITPSEPGTFTNAAAVATDSTDANADNDDASVDIDVYLPVELDILPGSDVNPLNLSKQGVVTVAILTTDDFDASAVEVAEACFGDAEDPAQRTCVEVHGHPHLMDVDKDKDDDLVFHFDAQATGIDLGDTTACIKGEFADGIKFYGCDLVTPF